LTLKLQDYGLKFKDKDLFENVNIEFHNNTISHLLGNNGCGKSSFAKSCVGMLDYKGTISGNDKVTLISSSSNVPNEFCIKDITEILKSRFNANKVEKLYELLKLGKITPTLPISKMSDGQKQKVKLYVFLSADNEIIILDEFTNALDKASSLELYSFINEYIKEYEVSIINITHNLTDLEYIPGEYFYIAQKNIVNIETKQEIIDKYIKGE